jgi:hypothetical protein
VDGELGGGSGRIDLGVHPVRGTTTIETRRIEVDATPATDPSTNPVDRQDTLPGTVTTITRRYLHPPVPIDIDRFEEGQEDSLRAGGPTNAEIILTFLSSNADQAFTPKEIHEGTGVPRGSVGVVLARLDERDLVRHRGEYWAIAKEADVDTTLTAMSTARVVTDRLGPEDPGEWGPGLEPEDE